VARVARAMTEWEEDKSNLLKCTIKKLPTCVIQKNGVFYNAFCLKKLFINRIRIQLQYLNDFLLFPSFDYPYQAENISPAF